MSSPFGDSRSLDPPAPAIHVACGGLVYDGVSLFDDLAITIPGGRTTCLLGPSGVGKSTLLNLIAGQIDASALMGRADIRCDDGGALAPRLSFMAQNDLLLPWLTVFENVCLGARLRGERPDIGRAGQILAAVGLKADADKRPAALSGGMRQRAALARTLMEDRPVVLMDEPFSALDAVTRLRLQDLAARLLVDRTVLLITHDPLEALRLGHDIRVMTGRPARIGDALDLGPLSARPPPRDPGLPGMLALQADLIRRLNDADQAA